MAADINQLSRGREATDVGASPQDLVAQPNKDECDERCYGPDAAAS
jgi:hypothetical protein